MTHPPQPLAAHVSNRHRPMLYALLAAHARNDEHAAHDAASLYLALRREVCEAGVMLGLLETAMTLAAAAQLTPHDPIPDVAALLTRSVAARHADD